MKMELDLPDTLEEQLKRLWIDTAGDAFAEVVKQQQTKRFLNASESAQFLHVSFNTFKLFSDIPRIVVSGVVRYDRLDLERYFESKKI